LPSFLKKRILQESFSSSSNVPLFITKSKCRQELFFNRYIFAIQYHGKYFLGFPRLKHETDQGDNNFKENENLPPSVEQCLHQALTKLVGENNFENIQVSSRTDAGVHALWNTFHVDIRPRSKRKKKENVDMETIVYDDIATQKNWDIKDLVNGLNYYLRRNQSREHLQNNSLHQPLYPYPQPNQNPFLRVIHATKAPQYIQNRFHEQFPNQPKLVDWHARHNAYERTYIYRIIVTTPDATSAEWSIPFEFQTSWRVYVSENNKSQDHVKNIQTDENPEAYMPRLLDIDEMKRAAYVLKGTHDFSAFRGKKCQRSSPVVYLKDIKVIQETPPSIFSSFPNANNSSNRQQHINIQVIGNAFLYRQVRNMVGCLVEIGKGNLSVSDVTNILLHGKPFDKSSKTAVAPAHGLYLANVKHEQVSDPLFGIDGFYDRLNDGRFIKEL